MTKRLIVGLAGLAVLAVALAVWPHQQPNDQLIIAGHTVTIDRATTDAQREKGLSGRAALADNHGLLFANDSDGRYGIWMKDMRFTIDVLWLDASGHVVYIVDDMEPSSYPMIYRPPQPARYVLELDGGAIERLGIGVGVAVSGL